MYKGPEIGINLLCDRDLGVRSQELGDEVGEAGKPEGVGFCGTRKGLWKALQRSAQVSDQIWFTFLNSTRSSVGKGL